MAINIEPLTAALRELKGRVRAAMRDGGKNAGAAAWAAERGAAELPHFARAPGIRTGHGTLPAAASQPLNRGLFFRRLAELDVPLVRVSFDGRDGRANFRSRAYVHAPGAGRLLEASPAAKAAAVTLDSPAGPRQLTVGAAAEAAARHALGAYCPAWDRNEGSFGQVDFVTGNQRIELDFNERYLTIENRRAEL
jgi:hypothetical protein